MEGEMYVRNLVRFRRTSTAIEDYRVKSNRKQQRRADLLEEKVISTRSDSRRAAEGVFVLET